MSRYPKTNAPRSARLVISLVTVACVGFLALSASNADAYTQTIADLEDPAVEAHVLELEVEASRGLSNTQTCNFEFCPSPFVLSSEGWNHHLKGSTGESLTTEQFPSLSIQQDPLSLRVTGQLETDVAEGSESYRDIESCQSGRITTASPRLDVTLAGFYQDGSASSDSPVFSLATQSVDPWTGCQVAAIDTSSRRTKISVPGPQGQSDPSGSWAQGDDHGLTTTPDGCAADHCDFTITGHNSGVAQTYSGSSSGSFTLKLRLEYPAAEEEQLKAPETTITRSPRKLIRTRSGKAKVAFGFESSGPKGTKFRCRLDGGAFKPCASTFKRRVGKGRHRFAVVSVFGGKTDPTPAVYKWRVRKTG